MPCALGGLYFDQMGPTGYQNNARSYFGSRKVWPEWNRLHKPLEVTGRITLRYIPMDIGFPDAPLVENPGYAQDIKMSGLAPLEFLNHCRADFKE